MIHSRRSSKKNRSIGATLAIGGMTLLSSCKIPDLCCAERGHTTPTNFNGVTTSDNSACVGFEEFFHDPVLTCLIDQGLSGNQELKILWQEVQIANNEVLKRRGAIFPFVTLGTRAGLDKASRFTRAGAVDSSLDIRPGHGIPTVLPDFLVAANVSWEVDIWRALRNARDAASLRYLGTYEGRNYTITRLVAEIAQNYYELMALDKRLEVLEATIALQEQGLEIAVARKEAARGTELAVQRFKADVARNQSEKLIIKQDIIETENRINFLLGRYPQAVERTDTDFINLNLHSLAVGVPSQLLQNRPDIRRAERQVQAAGLDIQVARARFYPSLTLTGGIGFEAFNPRYLVMTPESIVGSIVGDLVAPVINKSAIQADYKNANAVQLEAIYDYQRTVLNAFTEVINRISMVENYSQSIEIKKQQLAALESSVENARNLFQQARVEYIEVLFAVRDLQEARMVIIETKKAQLGAIVNAYQALGGGLYQHSCYPEAIVPTEPLPTDPLLEDGPTTAPAAPADATDPLKSPPPPMEQPMAPTPTLPSQSKTDGTDKE